MNQHAPPQEKLLKNKNKAKNKQAKNKQGRKE